MLDLCLHLLNDICDTMHGIDEKHAKRIVKIKITTKVVELYGRRGQSKKTMDTSLRNL